MPASPPTFPYGVNKKTLVDLVCYETHLAGGLLEVQIVLASELLAVTCTVPDCLEPLDTVAFHQRLFNTVRLMRVGTRAGIGTLQDISECFCLHF